MAEKVDPYAPLTPSMVKGLSDKLYDKRKAAALELERCGEGVHLVSRFLSADGV